MRPRAVIVGLLRLVAGVFITGDELHHQQLV